MRAVEDCGVEIDYSIKSLYRPLKDWLQICIVIRGHVLECCGGKFLEFIPSIIKLQSKGKDGRLGEI